jgi:hypothetical protein
VIREDDPVGIVVVHDPVESAGLDRDFLDDRQRLEVEHCDRRVAAVRRESAIVLRGQADAVHARRVRDVA